MGPGPGPGPGQRDEGYVGTLWERGFLMFGLCSTVVWQLPVRPVGEEMSGWTGHPFGRQPQLKS